MAGPEIEYLMSAAFGAGGAAITAVKGVNEVLGVAGSAEGWWSRWRRTSTVHKQLRILYVEVLFNLFLARLGHETVPPTLALVTSEWDRPSTREVVSRLLTVDEISAIAFPYTLLRFDQQVFSTPWPDQISLRWSGSDVTALGQLDEMFDRAEGILRKRLYSKKRQALIGEVIAKQVVRPTKEVKSNVQVWKRLTNAAAGVPRGLWLGSLTGLMAWLMRDFWRSLAPATRTVLRSVGMATTVVIGGGWIVLRFRRWIGRQRTSD